MKRLDIHLAKFSGGYSRSLLQKYIKEEGVSINEKIIRKPHFPVKDSDKVFFSPDDIVCFLSKFQQAAEEPVGPKKFPVIFENEELLVVNKPPNIDVAKIAQNLGSSLALVHRLDKGTSGVLVLAKNPVALAALQAKWQNREVSKEYVALVKGGLPRKGRIEAPISRSFRDRKKMAVSRGLRSRDSITEFTVVKDFGEVMLVSVHPLTGRTHQIRVHFASIKHSVVGDPIYGDRKLNAKYAPLGLSRQFLHAAKLSLTDPFHGKKQFIFEAPLSMDLQAVLDGLG